MLEFDYEQSMSDLGLPGAHMILEQIDLTGLGSVTLMATAPRARLNAVGGKLELHLGSLGGNLIGSSEYMEPSDAPGFTPVTLTAPITLPQGHDSAPQDLYLVFINDGGEAGSLMVVMGVEFRLANQKEATAQCRMRFNPRFVLISFNKMAG